MIPQHRGDKRAASCGWLLGFTLPAAVMGAPTRCTSRGPPAPRACGRPLWLTCPYGGRTRDGPKLLRRSKEGTGLFLPFQTFPRNGCVQGKHQASHPLLSLRPREPPRILSPRSLSLWALSVTGVILDAWASSLL